jgi:hypothetical protein
MNESPYARVDAQFRAEALEARFTTWRRHRCFSAHRNAAAFLRCALGHDPDISGAGPYAIIEMWKVPYRFDGRDRLRTDYYVALFPAASAAITAWQDQRAASAAGLYDPAIWDGPPPDTRQLVRVDLAGAEAWEDR